MPTPPPPAPEAVIRSMAARTDLSDADVAALETALIARRAELEAAPPPPPAVLPEVETMLDALRAAQADPLTTVETLDDLRAKLQAVRAARAAL